jgi:hypothetical protein
VDGQPKMATGAYPKEDLKNIINQELNVPDPIVA